MAETDDEKNHVVAGETDFLKPYGLELLSSCVDPVVVNHPKGHTVPRLGKYSLIIVMRMLALFWGFLLKLFIFYFFSKFQMKRACRPWRAF